MLLRLLSCAVTPPTPNTSTITPPACVMANPARIRRGRQLGQLRDATSAVGSSSPFSVSCLRAVSLQPPAVSRQPSAVSRLQPRPSPERREATAKPSEPFSRLLTRPARGKQPQAPQPSPNAVDDPARGQPKYPPSATLKVINTYVDNLLITC